MRRTADAAHPRIGQINIGFGLRTLARTNSFGRFVKKDRGMGLGVFDAVPALEEVARTDWSIAVSAMVGMPSGRPDAVAFRVINGEKAFISQRGHRHFYLRAAPRRE